VTKTILHSFFEARCTKPRHQLLQCNVVSKLLWWYHWHSVSNRVP